MKPRILKHRKARRDLVDLARFFKSRSAPLARRFLQAAERTFQFLAEFPEIGGVWETANISGDIRVCSIRKFKRYLIFYRPLADGIEVLRVLFGGRDINDPMEK